MKTLDIEWKHYDRDGETCTRCGGTGKNLRDAVSELNNDPRMDGVKIDLRETLLTVEQIAESNLLLFNGTPLEDILDDARAGESECASCSCLTGGETDCRTLVLGDMTYEEIPKETIREAILRAAGRQ